MSPGPLDNLPTYLRPEVLLDAVVRCRWLIIVPFCLAMVAGMVMAVKMPKVYEANTTILVQPQKVPSNFVRSLVSVDIDDRIRTIKQQILSYSNLEKIIAQYDLFSSPEQRELLMEEKIENLRRRIDVQVVHARGGADAFSIGFKGREPATVVKVANGLASYFINENLRVREAQAMGTSDFLDDELGAMRRRLIEMEEALKDYRRQHMGGLPEQLQTNLSILGRLQEELLEKQKAIRESKAAVLALEKQANELASMPDPLADLSMDDLLAEPVETDAPAGEDEIGALRKQLEALKVRYTDRHPDVIRLRRKIADLEAQAAADARAALQAAALTPPPEEAAAEEADTEPAQALPALDFQALQRAQVDQLRAEVAGQMEELTALRGQIEKYQRRVEDTPKREQELYSLKRDYENLKDAYNSLLARKLEADISVNMEKKQKGEQFQVLDVARRPEKPISPNVRMLFAASVAVGLGLGGGLVFLLAYLDQTVRRPEDLEALVGVPTMAAIPAIVRPEERRRRRWRLAAGLCGIGVSVGLCGAFGVLVIKGVDPTMTFVRHMLRM